jgi:signal transduction histidine kinase
MRERVEGLGGELAFTSNGRGGTRVDVKLPIL